MTLTTAISKLAHSEIVGQYKKVLTTTWNKETRAVITRSLNDITRLGGAITRDELNRIQRNVDNALGRPVAEAVDSKIVRIDEANWLNTRGAVEKELGVTLGWNLSDKAALDVLAQNTFFWVGSHYDRFVQDRIKGRLNEYFEGGLNRRDLALRLRADFIKDFARSDSYWDLLADHTATKVREMSRIANYEQAGVEVVRVRARLDEKTTDICQSLHGQVISVKDLRRQFDKQMRAAQSKDPAKVKTAWPWWTDKQTQRRINSNQDVRDNVKRGNIGMPPYHARCRTRTVAEFKADPGDRVLTPEDKALGARTFDDKKPGPAKKPRAEREAGINWKTRALRGVNSADDGAAWIEARHPGIAAEFTGISDPKAIEKILRPTLKELDSQLTKFPAVAERLKYVGTQRGPKWTKHLEDRLKEKGIPVNKRNLDRLKRRSRLESGTWAHNTTLGADRAGIQGIGLNTKYYNNLNEMQDSIKRSIASGHSPVGTTIESLTTHEFGHTIYNRAWSTPEFTSRINAFVNEFQFPANVGAYAESSLLEGWAESFKVMKYGTKAHKVNPYIKAQKSLLEELFGVKLP